MKKFNLVHLLLSFIWVTATASAATPTKYILENFQHIVTTNDLGFNWFSGNVGIFNDGDTEHGRINIVKKKSLSNLYEGRFTWDFKNIPQGFTGMYFCLAGTSKEDAFGTFTNKFINFDNIFGEFIHSPIPEKFNSLCMAVSFTGTKPLQLKLELKDTAKKSRYKYFTVAPGQSKTLRWNFRSDFRMPENQGSDDLGREKMFSFIVERSNEAKRIVNPPKGSLTLHSIWFEGTNEKPPITDDDYLSAVLKKSCLYFIDNASRSDESSGMPQDRSTFPDLLTTGGVGFSLPAFIIAVEHGWLTREVAALKVRRNLEVLGDDSRFGPEATNKSGYRGWYYHFFGLDGTRKTNIDFPETPKDESKNTVELSSIDTGLLLMGVLAAQSYFNADNPNENEIRFLAQKIYDRVDWPFMIRNTEPNKMQFYLGWKPYEERDSFPYFEIPDNEYGHYSGQVTNGIIYPGTLDYYTDEVYLLSLLALGARVYPLPTAVVCAWIRQMDDQGLVRTWPGALFTYQFARAFVDTESLSLPACSGDVNWYNNSRLAIKRVISHASTELDFTTFTRLAWGINATEGPDDSYKAYSIPTVSWDPEPVVDGTVTYYGMISSASFGNDLKKEAVKAIQRGWSRGHWHSRFGLPDAFNDEIEEGLQLMETNSFLRLKGPWVQHALFAIDQGPMLLHLENASSGLIWNLLESNPNIQRGITRFEVFKLREAEAGAGYGTSTMERSEASGGYSVWLPNDNSSIVIPINVVIESDFELSIRYSNDNLDGSTETIHVYLDDTEVASFASADTGDSGHGWNVFTWKNAVGPFVIPEGNHQIKITATGGDAYGCEIDAIQLSEYVGM